MFIIVITRFSFSNMTFTEGDIILIFLVSFIYRRANQLKSAAFLLTLYNIFKCLFTLNNRAVGMCNQQVCIIYF